jgi:hypothetical protein
MLLSGREEWKIYPTVHCRPGVRVGHENTNRFFDKEWEAVLVEMDGLTTLSENKKELRKTSSLIKLEIP